MSENILIHHDDLDIKSVSSDVSRRSYKANKVLPIEQFQSLRDEMKFLRKKFLGNAPTTIGTPFKGTALAISNDQSLYVFPSKEGRVAVCDAKNKRILLDKDVKETSVWTLALFDNNSFILTGGSEGVIRKLKVDDLKEVDKFIGHQGEINYVIISPDQLWAYSASDDQTVRKWSLTVPNPPSEILYSHEGIVYGMDLSLDGTLLSSVSGDGSLTVFRSGTGQKDSNTVLTNLRVNSSILWISKFSPNNSLIAAGSEDSNAYVWSTKNWNLVKTLKGHQQRVRCMNFTHSGSILITGGIDNLIKVWDMKGNKATLTLEHHKDWVRAVIISPDDCYCTSLGDDCKIIKWKIPRFQREIDLQSDASVISKMWTSLDSATIFGVTESFYVKSWNGATGEQTTEYKIKIQNILHFSETSSRLSINVFTSVANPDDPDNPNTKIDQISAYTGEIEKEFTLKGVKVFSSLATIDGRFFIIGTEYTLNIYDVGMNLYHSFRANSGKVIAISSTSNNEFLFSADAQGGVIMFNIPNKEVERKLLPPKPETAITQIKISRNDQYLFVVHSLFLDIYSVAMKGKLYTIRSPGIKHISFSSDCSKIFVFDRNSLNMYNSENFSLFYSQVFRTPTSYIIFAANADYYVLYRGNVSKIVPNPLNIKDHTCLGKYDEIDNFEDYITKIIKDKADKHVRNFDRMLIMPNWMNALHFYAYYNLPTILEQALVEDGPFYASKSGHTPLSIALELKYVGCVRAVIKGMSLRHNEHPLTLYFFENAITDLNLLGYGGLHRIYNLMFGESLNRSLPKFSLLKTEEIYREGDTLLLNPVDFMPVENYSSDGTSITFKQSYFKLPLIPGSLKSLEFIESLIDCKNIRIYDTKIVQLILAHKFSKLKWLMYIQAVIYMTFCVLLDIYTVNYLNDKQFLYAIIANEGILFGYELVQICANRLEYFKDIMNWVDIAKTSLFLAYVIRVQLDYTDNPRLLSVLLFVTMFRGISYFRLFSDTRYYINLLFEVVKDLVPFLIILYYSSIGFAMVFLSLDRGNDNVYSNYLVWTYPTDVPNAPQDGYTQQDWLTYFLVSMLISIIMLSLVVSILSDTYARVNEHSVVAESQTLAQMIYESELLYFWNRKKNQTSFIYLCSVKEEIVMDKSDILKKVKKLKNIVTGVGKKINGNRRLMKNLKATFTINSDAMISSLNELT